MAGKIGELHRGPEDGRPSGAEQPNAGSQNSSRGTGASSRSWPLTHSELNDGLANFAVSETVGMIPGVGGFLGNLANDLNIGAAFNTYGGYALSGASGGMSGIDLSPESLDKLSKSVENGVANSGLATVVTAALMSYSPIGAVVAGTMTSDLGVGSAFYGLGKAVMSGNWEGLSSGGMTDGQHVDLETGTKASMDILLPAILGAAADGLNPLLGPMVYSLASELEVGSRLYDGVEYVGEKVGAGVEQAKVGWNDMAENNRGWLDVAHESNGGFILDSVDFILTSIGAAGPRVTAEMKSLGTQSIAGFCQGFEEGNPEFEKVVEGCVGITEETLDSHSPSRVFMRLGEYSAEGFIEGLSSVIGDTGKVAADVVGAMDGELATFSSTTGSSSSEDAGTGEGSASGWLSEFGAAISGGITQMSELFTSVSSINAILNPMGTIMTSMMEVLEPVINEVLSPLVGILTTVGTLFGNVLAPALQIITPIIRIVAEGFVWLYNKILVPIGNGFITVFNAIYNAVAWVYNKVAWLWGGRLETRDLKAGHLQTISTDGLTQSGANYTGAGGSDSTGSSTSVNSYKIEVYQTIEGNVIGDGGMAAIGEFFVQAVQEYYGSGGKISLVMAAK